MNHADKITSILYDKLDKKVGFTLLPDPKDTADTLVQTTFFRVTERLDSVELDKWRGLSDEVYYSLEEKLRKRNERIFRKIMSSIKEKSDKHLIILSDGSSFLDNMLDLYGGEPDKYTAIKIGNSDFGEFLGTVAFYYVKAYDANDVYIKKGTIKVYSTPKKWRSVEITGIRRTYSVIISKKLTTIFETPLKAIIKDKQYLLKTVGDLYNVLIETLQALGSTKTEFEEPNVFVSEQVLESLYEELDDEIRTGKNEILSIVNNYIKTKMIVEKL